MSKPIIRSVQSERAARIGADTVTQHEWPMTTATLVADALKAFEKGDAAARNSKVYSLIRLKILLAHAQIQIGVAMWEYPDNAKVRERLLEIKEVVTIAQDSLPLKVIS